MGLFGNKKESNSAQEPFYYEEIRKKIEQAKSENDAKPVVIPIEGLDENECKALRFIRILISDRYNLVPRRDMNTAFAANIMAEYYNVPIQRGKQIYRKHGST